MLFRSYASVLAQQKMEQLRALTYGFDALNLPVTDSTTNLASVPEAPTGGTGLAPSPAGALDANTVGYVDYVDANGASLGGGTPVPPNGTVYIRRWSVQPLPTNPANTLVMQVLVTRKQATPDPAGETSRHVAGEARIVTVKTRKPS